MNSECGNSCFFRWNARLEVCCELPLLNLVSCETQIPHDQVLWQELSCRGSMIMLSLEANWLPGKHRGGGKWGHFRIILRSFAWSSSFVFWDILSDWKVNSFSFMKWNNLGDVCEKTIAMFVFQMLYLAKAQINGRWQLVELLPIIWENRRASWLYESWLMKND